MLRRNRIRAVGAALAAALVVVGAALGAAPASAAGDGGASSRVVGRGNIVTTILGWSSPTRRSSSGTAPSCRWVTLTDAQLEFLLAVSPYLASIGRDTPWNEPLRGYTGSGTLPDGDLQLRMCDGTASDVRFVESTASRTDVRVLVRQMITQLPAPEPTFSPPGGTAVPVGQPVFVTIAPEQWRPVEGTLAANGLVAQVRARPTAIRVITGDPAAETATCSGPGIRFDPSTTISPARQSLDPTACVVTYRSASSDGTGPRPATWLGTVSVMWSAEWRVGAGPWRDLGLIPRTRVIDRVVREVSTSIEAGPTAGR